MSTLPQQIRASMVPYVASVAILQGQAVALDSANPGQVILQDNFTTKLPCIGVAVNNALVGQTVYVQREDVITVPTAHTCTPGHFVGSARTVASDSTMNDLGVPTASFTAPIAIAGIAISQSGNQLTMLVLPVYIETVAAASSGVTSFNSRTGAVLPAANDYAANQLSGYASGEVPSTFNTNSEYVLAHTPNPASSVQVFVNGVYLVQGTDYNIVGTHIVYVAPIVTNTIVAFYQF